MTFTGHHDDMIKSSLTRANLFLFSSELLVIVRYLLSSCDVTDRCFSVPTFTVTLNATDPGLYDYLHRTKDMLQSITKQLGVSDLFT